MYKVIVFLIIFPSMVLGQISLNKDLLYRMSTSDAKAVLEKDNSYANITFSKDVIWSISFEDLVFEDDQLRFIVLKPAGNFFGINYIKTLNHIKTSKEYLQQRGYQLLDEHPSWNRPQAYVTENAAYVSLLKNEERKLLVKLDVERFKGSYMPTITITHLENKESLTNKTATESTSGF